MSYKRILVLAFGRSDAPAIEAGAWLAAEHEAVTHVLPVFPDIASELAVAAASFGGGVPSAALQAAEEIAAEAMLNIESACFTAADAADVVLGPEDGAPRMIVHEHDRRVWDAIGRACALVDLVVISGRLVDQEPDRANQLFEEVLMRQRQPLLIVRGPPEALAGRAIIAWNGRIEAGRAVKAALPLLGGCSAIDILHHPEGAGASGPSTTDLSDYLRLHDVGPAEVIASSGDDAGEAILDACRSREAGLLVAGAYGHSRLRQVVLGGVTRTLLAAADGPSLLLSH